MRLEYDTETLQLSLVFTPLPASSDEEREKKAAKETRRRVELSDGDGYLDVVESPDYTDFLERVCLNRVATSGYIDAVIYNDSTDTLIIRFAQPVDRAACTIAENESYALELKKENGRVLALSLSNLALNYEDVRLQLLSTPEWKRALDAGSLSIRDERRSNKKLRCKARQVQESARECWPKHFEPSFCDFCMLFSKKEIETYPCILCEEFVAVCNECKDAALTAGWDGYLCGDCAKHEKRRCKEGMALLGMIDRPTEAKTTGGEA